MPFDLCQNFSISSDYILKVKEGVIMTCVGGVIKICTNDGSTVQTNQVNNNQNTQTQQTSENQSVILDLNQQFK